MSTSLSPVLKITWASVYSIPVQGNPQEHNLRPCLDTVLGQNPKIHWKAFKHAVQRFYSTLLMHFTDNTSGAINMPY